MLAEEFWAGIKDALAKKGKTQEWLCKETGMDLQSMRNRIYKNRFPTIEETLKILSVFGTTAEAFFGISQESLAKEAAKDVTLIPVMEQAFSAGRGQYVPDTEEVKEWISVPKELKKYGDKFAASRVRGDSMEPTLFDGDIIISDANGYDGSDGIYTIIYKGNGFVKRLQRSVGGVKIISDNRHYDPMFESSESDDFRVIGKVRSVMHNM
ncbi:MAG: S24 family peptidase [Treponema sp.]|nr:S24 family peptidase [Treponema sp.]